MAAWLCLRRSPAATLGEAFRLGGLWLVVALPLDLLAFVLVRNPLALSARDFYLGQFPWIYLTYLTVLLSPAVPVLLERMARRAC